MKTRFFNLETLGYKFVILYDGKVAKIGSIEHSNARDANSLRKYINALEDVYNELRTFEVDGVPLNSKEES